MTAERAQRVLDTVGTLARETDPARSTLSLALGSHLERDLSLSSLERAELVTRLEAALGQSVDDRAVMQAETVADLLAAVNSEPAPRSTRNADGDAMHAQRRAAGGPPPNLPSLTHVLRWQADRRSDETAITFVDGDDIAAVWSWRNLMREAHGRAEQLTRAGVTSGDRVGLMLSGGPDFVGTFLGALLAGIVPVPLYPPMRANQAEEFVRRQGAILADCSASTLILEPAALPFAWMLRPHAPHLQRILAPAPLGGAAASAPLRAAGPEDVAFLQYTSGSTGQPRGVVVTHGAVLRNLRAFCRRLGVGANDMTVSWLPLYHDMGLIGMLLGSLHEAIPLYLMAPQDFLGRPLRWLRRLTEHRATISAAPNFAYEMCARRIPDDALERLDLSAWRVAVNGAEPVLAETIERFAARFAPVGFHRAAFTPAYGLAEATLAVTVAVQAEGPRIEYVRLLPSGDVQPATASEGTARVSNGSPVADVEVRITDGDDRPLGEWREGRIQVRGPACMPGYFHEVGAVDVPPPPRAVEAWLDTGDLGFMAEGELFVTGRTKAIIVKAGRKIHAEDVERAANEAKGVRRGCVAAFGVPSEIEGTEDLVVVVESGAEPAVRDGVLREVRARIERAVGLPPDRVVVAPPRSVPKTPSGKVRRSACRDRYRSGRLQGERDGRLAVTRLLLADLPAWARHLARQVGRHAWSLWCGACVLAWGVAILVGGWMGADRARRTARVVSRLLLQACGVRLGMTPQPLPDGPLMVVANHASIIDPIAITAAFDRPLRFAAAPWVLAHPLLRPLGRALGAVEVVRGDASRATREAARMASVLKAGETLVAFAEGGVEAAPGLRPFVLGPFLAAAESGVPILPVSLDGTRRTLRWGTWPPRPATVRVTLTPLIMPSSTGIGEVSAIARKAREQIGAYCGEPHLDRRLMRRD